MRFYFPRFQTAPVRNYFVVFLFVFYVFTMFVYCHFWGLPSCMQGKLFFLIACCNEL